MVGWAVGGGVSGPSLPVGWVVAGACARAARRQERPDDFVFEFERVLFLTSPALGCPRVPVFRLRGGLPSGSRPGLVSYFSEAHLA